MVPAGNKESLMGIGGWGSLSQREPLTQRRAVPWCVRWWELTPSEIRYELQHKKKIKRLMEYHSPWENEKANIEDATSLVACAIEDEWENSLWPINKCLGYIQRGVNMAISRRTKIVKWLNFRFRQAGDMHWTCLHRGRGFLKSRLDTLQTEML